MSLDSREDNEKNGFNHNDSEEEDKKLLSSSHESENAIWSCIQKCLGCFGWEDH